MSPETFASPSEDLDARRRKLSFRSWTRGTQESDLILGSFADESLMSLDDIQLERFQALLDCSDLELFDWIFGISASPPEHDHDVLRLLRDFCAARHARPQ
ncbi:MAG TPA: succinate dehydrogenase assembly factor 2 [Caulobacteraceae bacterium]|jgi:antitoxin CptB